LPKAIIVAPEHDIHAFAVQLAGKSLGAEIPIIDIGTFPADIRLSTFLGAGATKTILRHPFLGEIAANEISGLWWRRPRWPDPDKVIAHPTASRVAAAESWQAIVGSLMATVKNVFNEPAKSAAAAVKLFQLEMAAFMGLRVPRTLVTNDPEQARSFVENQSAGAICKMLSGATAGPGFETHRLEKLDDLWRIKNCPIFLQEYVAGEHDVRVTVIGERVFSARIEFEKDQNCIDTHFTSKSISETRLPLDIEVKITSLVRTHGLVYSAVDLRYSNGEYTFFELNPEGQYLWIEIESGLPISAEIARRLIGT
jgi:hypothetical protein